MCSILFWVLAYSYPLFTEHLCHAGGHASSWGSPCFVLLDIILQTHKSIIKLQMLARGMKEGSRGGSSNREQGKGVPQQVFCWENILFG